MVSDPASITGTGKDGRITKEERLPPLAAAKPAATAQAPAAAAPAAAPRGGRKEERVKMTRLRQTIAKRLKGSAEHRRDADDVQRRRHDRGDRRARQV